MSAFKKLAELHLADHSAWAAVVERTTPLDRRSEARLDGVYAGFTGVTAARRGRYLHLFDVALDLISRQGAKDLDDVAKRATEFADRMIVEYDNYREIESAGLVEARALFEAYFSNQASKQVGPK